jgi:hypothetical protein
MTNGPNRRDVCDGADHLEVRDSVCARPTTCSSLYMKERKEKTEPETISASQSGADQALPDTAEADSESVKELVAEGQSFEASAVEAVEETPEPDVSEVHTREIPEDDVPQEYLDRD